MYDNHQIQPSGAYFHAFLQLSRERMPRLRALNPNITPSQARYLLLDIWKNLNVNERKWYVWRAVNLNPELRKKEAIYRAASAPSGPRVVGKPAPTLTDDDRYRTRSKTPSGQFGEINLILAIKYCEDQDETQMSQDTNMVKSSNTSVSPFLNRVAYARDIRMRRNQLSKSAPARKEQSQKKKSFQERKTVGMSNINFSERASYWTRDASVISRVARWEDVESGMCSANYKTKTYEHLESGTPAVDSPEQAVALPAAKDPVRNENCSLVSAQEPPSSETAFKGSQFSPSLRKKDPTQGKGRVPLGMETPSLRPLTKSIPQRPRSATKPLFSLTSLEVDEEDVMKSMTPEELQPVEAEKAVAIADNPKKKYNSTASGVAFRDFGPSSVCQKSDTKVCVAGFGRTAKRRNKEQKKVNTDINFSPNICQISLLERTDSPRETPPFLTHYALTSNAGSPQPGPSVVNIQPPGNCRLNPSSKLEEQGFLSASYVNKLLNRSNNSNKEVLGEPEDNSSGLKHNKHLILLTDETQNSKMRIEKMYDLSKPISRTSSDIISIPYADMIDNFSDVFCMSGEDDDLDEESNEPLQFLPDDTSSMGDPSVVELELSDDLHANDQTKEPPEDAREIAQLELTDTSLDETQSSLSRYIYNCSKMLEQQLQIEDINDITFDSADDSIDFFPLSSNDCTKHTESMSPSISSRQLEIPRSAGVTSPEYPTNMELEHFLHCSESSISGDDDSNATNSLLFDSEISDKVNDLRMADIWNRSKLNEDKTDDSELLWNYSRMENTQFPKKNKSFRMAMKNPVTEIDNYYRTTSGIYLLDLFVEDEQDCSPFSTTSFTDKSALNDFIDDLKWDDHSYCMKTSTPIKATFNKPGEKGAGQTPQKAPETTETSQEFSSLDSDYKDEINLEYSGQSSEEDEVIEIIYTTSSSSEDHELFIDESPKDLFDNDSTRDLSNTRESLNSTNLSQISGVAKSLLSGSCVASETDCSLGSLSFSTMVRSQKNNKLSKPTSNADTRNITWHPDTNVNRDNVNQTSMPKKPKLRRSYARTNLLAKFDDAVEKDVDDCCDHGLLKSLIEFGNTKSPLDALRPAAKNDEIYKVGVKSRRSRYSENPSSSLKSRFWAPRQYVEETESAVRHLLEAEFSSPSESI